MAFPLSAKEEIGFILDYVLPFVNIPEQNPYIIINKYPTFEDAAFTILPPDTKNYKTEKSPNDHILSAYSFIKYLLKAALSNKSLKELQQSLLYDEPDDFLDELGSIASKDMFYLKPLYYFPPNYINQRIAYNVNKDKKLVDWTNFGNTSVFCSVYDANEFNVKYTEYVITNSIVDTFWSKTNSDNHNKHSNETIPNSIKGMPYNQNTVKLVQKGIGFDYVGFCPRCEKFFVKNRKNQFYCSQTCSASIRVLKKYHRDRN